MLVFIVFDSGIVKGLPVGLLLVLMLVMRLAVVISEPKDS